MLHKAMAEQNKDYIADHHKKKQEKNQAAGGAAGMSCWCKWWFILFIIVCLFVCEMKWNDILLSCIVCT